MNGNKHKRMEPDYSSMGKELRLLTISQIQKYIQTVKRRNENETKICCA